MQATRFPLSISAEFFYTRDVSTGAPDATLPGPCWTTSRLEPMTPNLKEIPMSITVEEKHRLIKEFATKEGDTG